MGVNEVFKGYAAGHGTEPRGRAGCDVYACDQFRPNRIVVYTCKTNKATPAVLATPRGLAETLWEVPTMQAYASADVATAAELRPHDLRSAAPGSPSMASPSAFGFEEMLSQLADLVAARVIEKLVRADNAPDDDWLDTRDASEYLGIHRDSLRRLAAERAIPAEQAGAGCKLFFRRSDLDAWRRRASASVIDIRSRHDG